MIMHLKLIILPLFALMSFNGYTQIFNRLSTTTEADLSYLTPPSSVKTIGKNVNDTAFAFNIHRINSGPIAYYNHALNDFANRSLISEGTTRPLALSWNQEMTVLYGINDSDFDLISVDPITGESTHIADFSGIRAGEIVLGLTIDANNDCYVASSNELNSSTLYRCNLSTGELTTIGSQSVASQLVDITASCDDTLYGFDGITNNLVSIDKTDGSVTLIGDIGINTTNEITDLMYDRDAGVLYQYIIARNDTDFPFTGFASLNSSTGEATLLNEFVPGIYNGAIKTSCNNNNGFLINPALNGGWFNPATAGQGFLIDVLPESNTFFMAWFTNDTSLPDESLVAEIGNPGNRWLTIQGELNQKLGGRLELAIFNTSGGIFNQSAMVNNEQVGTMTVIFNNCSEGLIEFLFNNGITGTIPIQRLANDNVALCEALSNPN
jgi:hypothetical protein